MVHSFSNKRNLERRGHCEARDGFAAVTSMMVRKWLAERQLTSLRWRPEHGKPLDQAVALALSCLSLLPIDDSAAPSSSAEFGAEPGDGQ
jgi:hypothetical protein